MGGVRIKNRNIIWYFLLFVLITNSSVAGEPEFEWQAQLSFSSGSTIWDVIQTSEEGFIGVGEIKIGTNGQSALTITSTDQYGTVLWENTLLSLGNSSARSIARWDNGFAICGVAVDSLGEQGLVMKINAQGNTEWILTVGYENNDALYGLCTTSDRNIIAVGYSINDETLDNDVFVASVSPTGELLWRKRFVLPEYQTAYSIIPSGEIQDDFIVTGSDNGNLFLMCLKSNGDWRWKTNHILDGYQVGNEVCLTSEGEYVVAGLTRSQSGFSDALLVFFDKNGAVIRDHIWGTDGPDNAYSIREQDPAGFVVLMNSNSGTGDGYRPILYRFDPWLSEIWSVEIANLNALCYSFRSIENCGYIISGQSTSDGHGNEYSSSIFKFSPEDLFHWD